MACNAADRARSVGWEDPLEKEMATCSLPGKSHGQRSLVGYSAWGRKESDRLSDFTFTFCFLEICLSIYFLTLQYCIGLVIYQDESATGIHMFPILNPHFYMM